MLILFSKEWSGSLNCQEEYRWAVDAHEKGGDRPKIIPILFWDGEFDELNRPGHAGLNKFNGERLDASLEGEGSLDDKQEEALNTLWGRLKGEFAKVGVTPTRPKYNPERGPYRGLEALHEQDGAVFFGRDMAVDEIANKLRTVHKERSKRLVPIVAASGAGKSSLLRAGLVPRIKYYAEDFYCLPVMRPHGAAISGEGDGLVAVLNAAFTPSQKHPRLTPLPPGMAADAVAAGMEGVEELLRDLQRQASQVDPNGKVVNPVTLVLPIDQGEELLPVESDNSQNDSRNVQAQQARAILAALLKRRKVPLIAVIAIRSDSYPLLQVDKELRGIEPELCDLGPLPQTSYISVIKEPARVSGLPLDDALAQRLLQDVAGLGDALPLLAFVLQRMLANAKQATLPEKSKLELGDYKKLGLKLEDYTALGGIGGAIEQVVAETLGASFDQAMLRRAFVPRLVTVSSQSGAFLRRPANWDELPPDARPMLQALADKARLLTVGKTSVEVAHEAVLRQWALLNGWLEEARSALWFLGQAEQAAATWADGRQKLVTAHGESSAEVVQFDRAQLWLQDRLDSTWQALEQVGQSRLTEPLSSFIRPEFDRLLDELKSRHVDHARRAEIGDRLATLGDRTVDNKPVAFGDLRPGVNTLTLARINSAWKPADEGADRRSRQLAAWRQHLSNGLKDVPDIVWCHVAKPSGPIAVYTQAEAGTGAPAGDPVQCTIESEFWVSKYPVTLSQFIPFTGEGAPSAEYQKPEWWTGFDGEQQDWRKNGIRPQPTQSNYPAQYVSWYQGVAYCRWLTARYREYSLLPPGSEIRLPFEAEWILAATGGLPNRTYPWGNEWNSDFASNQIGINRFVAVGLYPQGQAPTGALDMSGNVYEWCRNAYDDLNDPALTRRANRATKGGSYYTHDRVGKPEHALSVHHRLEDNPLALTKDNARIGAGIRLVATGLIVDSPLLATETLIP